jgi:hypothetical protein
VATVLEAADTAAGGFAEARRAPQSFAQTEALAEQLGMTADELLKRPNGTAFNAEQSQAARSLLVASAEKVDAIAARIAEKGDPGEDLLNEFRDTVLRHVAIQEQVAGVVAEAGRALGILRNRASSVNITADMLDAMMAGKGPAGLQRAARNIIEAGKKNPRERAKAIEERTHPELMPRPTRCVPQMIALVEQLVARGHAYVAADGVEDLEGLGHHLGADAVTGDKSDIEGARHGRKASRVPQASGGEVAAQGLAHDRARRGSLGLDAGLEIAVELGVEADLDHAGGSLAKRGPPASDHYELVVFVTGLGLVRPRLELLLRGGARVEPVLEIDLHVSPLAEIGPELPSHGHGVDDDPPTGCSPDAHDLQKSAGWICAEMHRAPLRPRSYT